MVYVDDFKISGPIDNIPKAWELIKQGLVIEPPKRIDEKGIIFLGCRTYKKNITLPDGTSATAVVYDQQEYLQSCVQKYISLCYMLKITPGDLTKTRRSYTPFIQEDHKASPAGPQHPGQVSRRIDETGGK